ncbi:hypothetical protein BRADI_5g09165v3 [Brachypodium distachyon]|uniref:Uncharacterized protein n=1 Tax=Brachypodium distachyon TaxID=15368 RepID=A0A0Q3E3U0_BRADI|nr:hypothetical protein BRADI_5g09165v3 [Brachypodium distachyon]
MCSGSHAPRRASPPPGPAGSSHAAAGVARSLVRSSRSSPSPFRSAAAALSSSTLHAPSRSYADAVALGGPCDAPALLGKAHSAPSSPRSVWRSEARPRLSSVVVGSLPSLPAAEKGNPWISVPSRSRRPSPLNGRLPKLPGSSRRPNGASSPSPARAAFLRRFRGRCFRCLSTNHRRAACRDPPRCIECWAWGHLASESSRCRAARRSPATPAPLTAARPSLPVRFPAPPPSAEMLSRAITMPAPRRSGSTHSVVMASRFVEHQVFVLRNHGVLAKAIDKHHSASPILVGKAIRGTRHHPEAFFIHFDFPAHRDRPWRELDHGSIERHDLHVRVAIEKMPLHLWSIEGAEQVFGKDVIVDRLYSRTYAKEDTRLFSCWVWCRSLDRIPSDHAFTVFRSGAGRIAPPPEGIRFNTIIHIDLVEDWTVRELYSWFEGLYDGDVPTGDRRRIPVSCRDAFTLAPRRDDTGDDDDLQRRPGRNSGTARAQPPRVDAAPSGLVARVTGARLVDPLAPAPLPVHALAPAPPASLVTASSQRSTSSEDPLAELIASERLSDIDLSTQEFDPMVAATPLLFSPSPAGGRPGLGSFSPLPLGPVSPSLTLPVGESMPQDVATDSDDTDGILQSLFGPAACLGPRRFIAPVLADRQGEARPTPRRSARQAGRASSTPVAQRATICLAKELAVIEPGDQRTDAAASALVQRFKEPLSDVDIDGFAVLTRIDLDALLRAAAQASASRAATQAH